MTTQRQNLSQEDDLLAAILQPRTGKRSEYIDAPEVQEVAEAVVEEFGLFDASLARVKYLFKSAEKSKFRGQISLAGAKWKHLTGFDYVVEVWQQFWENASDPERKALMYHELLHVERTETKRGTKWVLRDHPVEAFPEEVQQFGTWTPELRQLAEIFGVKAEEGEKV